MRLVLLAVVLGIALMHHLGGMRHDERGGCADPDMTTTATTVATGPALDPAIPRHTDSTRGPDVGDMLHLCLAVVAAIATTLLLVVLGVAGDPPGPLRPIAGSVGDGHSRAPPVPRRLAQLQVFRI